MPHQHRSAVVTGGATGIGHATAVALAGAGFALTLVGRRAEALRTAASDLTDAGATVEVQVADVGDPQAPAAVVDAHVARFGGIGAFVAAAGAWESTPLTSLTAADWDATLDVHLRGAVLGAGAAARHMVEAGHGRLVFVSSVNGYASEPHTAAYSAAKTAVVSLARSFAVELGSTGVTANVVAPGWVDTPMTASDLASSSPQSLQRLNPQARFGRPAEIAEIIRWLAVDAPWFLTGATIVADGGQLAAAALP